MKVKLLYFHYTVNNKYSIFLKPSHFVRAI